MPFFQHKGVNLFYTVQGNGPPILLLHGYACDGNDWSFQIPLLVSLNYTVIALDQRGHGRSTAPQDTASYSLSAFAEDAVALLEHVECGPAIIMGHSMGTVIASAIAVEHPGAVTALILVHPIYAGVPDALSQMAEDMHAEPEFAAEIAEEFFTKVMYTPRTPAWLKTWTLRRVLGTDSVALRGSVQGLVDTFGTVMGKNEKTKAYMRRRKVDRLVAWTMENAPEWETEIGIKAGDRVEKLGSEGTFSHMVESESFNKLLAEWLKGRPVVESTVIVTA